MPIFEFQCKECRNEFKTLRRSDKLDEVNCPTCGTRKVVRLLSVTARSSGSSQPDSCAMPPGGC